MGGTRSCSHSSVSDREFVAEQCEEHSSKGHLRSEDLQQKGSLQALQGESGIGLRGKFRISL